MIVETAPQPTTTPLHASLRQLLQGRGVRSDEDLRRWLQPTLDDVVGPESFPDLAVAVAHLRAAIEREEPIGLYADRDVDGLAGLAILARSLRTLGAVLKWGSPCQGRGVERAILEKLIAGGARTIIFIDCGTSEDTELRWLADQGVAVIVADHHRLGDERAPALAWIHPGVVSGGPDDYAPAGCVMAFKLAQGLWHSFLGVDDHERLDYFLYDHLDLLCLGILADRVTLTGENRVFVWHGLRRLAQTRKAGLHALLRFFRLHARALPVSVREATWQIIPLLNAAGRLRQPEWTSDLLLTEDNDRARDCIDAMLELNTQRRSAQQKSLEEFERLVIQQCAVETDAVLFAIGRDLEPSVTGLAAGALAVRYGKPVFLFVHQGDEAVGSARGINNCDLFAWVERHSDLIVKFGGHQGAVGLTVRREHFSALHRRLLDSVPPSTVARVDVSVRAETSLPLAEADETWWKQLGQLEPFGPGFPSPLFELTGVERIRSARVRTQKSLLLEAQGKTWLGECDGGLPMGEGPWTVTASAVAGRKDEPVFKWMIQSVVASTPLS